MSLDALGTTNFAIAFTMVEENFEMWPSEAIHIKWF